jgi:hypothetical protein
MENIMAAITVNAPDINDNYGNIYSTYWVNIFKKLDAITEALQAGGGGVLPSFKTINGQSITGSGDIPVMPFPVEVKTVASANDMRTLLNTTLVPGNFYQYEITLSANTLALDGGGYVPAGSYIAHIQTGSTETTHSVLLYLKAPAVFEMYCCFNYNGLTSYSTISVSFTTVDTSGSNLYFKKKPQMPVILAPGNVYNPVYTKNRLVSGFLITAGFKFDMPASWTDPYLFIINDTIKLPPNVTYYAMAQAAGKNKRVVLGMASGGIYGVENPVITITPDEDWTDMAGETGCVINLVFYAAKQ